MIGKNRRIYIFIFAAVCAFFFYFRISFVSQSRTGNIILEITIDIKPFDKIESRNISVHCLMGSVRSVLKVFNGRHKELFHFNLIIL